MKYQQEPIAIIGIGCRFPGGANSHKAFWRLLTQGKDAIVDVPPDRWDNRKFYDPDPDKPGKVYVKQGGFLKEKIYDFDPLFFGISPREAESMDPQQRLLLEITWEAFEDAGLVVEELSGSRTGVFIGGFALDNLVTRLTKSNRELADSHTGTSCSMTLLSNRISYVFDLQGPSISIDTACSSSLVTTHYACQSLWNGESDIALAGGVNIMLGPEYSIILSKGRFLSEHARCMAFDKRAAGYSRAEGAGIAVLKPLSKALEDKDQIYALINMSGVNQDGHTQGVSMPNSDAQEELVRDTYKRAGISPAKIGYIEAHGTGTQAGDPKEIRALDAVLSEGRKESEICYVGSVKSNIGHLEAGAGIAGLTKAALCLKHNKIPPNLHFEEPNPNIPFDDMCLRVPTKLEDWPEHTGPRYAGVNSFGYGGTNAHVLLQEAPPQPEPEPISFWNKPYLLPLSARSESALHELAGKYAFFLTSQSDPRTLADFLHTVTQRRSHHSHRATLIASTQDELREKLQLFSSGDYTEYTSTGVVQIQEQKKLTFIYTGMGPQWWAMGRELMEQEPIFLETIRECDELFQKISGWSILQALQEDEANSQIARTEIAQPANFVIQVSLTAVWHERGIRPDAIIGHSVGEVAAAYISGALSLEDAIKVSVHRSQLQSKTVGGGAMLAVGLPEQEALELIEDYNQVSIGAINSPSGVTLSGSLEQLEKITAILNKDEIFNRKLDVEVAYHSPEMESIKDELFQSLTSIQPGTTQYPLYSTVTGKLIDGNTLDADYWWQNIREPVRFADGIRTLLEQGFINFLEIGPHPVLAHSVKEIAGETQTKVNLVASLNRKFPEQLRMLESLGELYSLGFSVSWQSTMPTGGRFVSIPTYPWQKERYWSESLAYAQDRFGSSDNIFISNKLSTAHPTWAVEINEQFFPFLSEHKVNGEVVFPGTAYIEAALSVYKSSIENKNCILSEVQIHNMLFIDPKQIQILSIDYDQFTQRFSIHSKHKSDESAWKLHVSGKFIDDQYHLENKTIDINDLKSHINNEVNIEEMYNQLTNRGLSYGLTFQKAQELWISDSEILIHIGTSNAGRSDYNEYLLYPPLADTALHSILSIIPGKTPYVPVTMDKVLYHESPGDTCWCYGKVTKRHSHTFDADYFFCDSNEKLLIELRGVSHQKMLSSTTREEDFLRDSLYEPKWITYQNDFKDISSEINECLIFAHESDIYSALIDQLEERKASYISIFHEGVYQQSETKKNTIDGHSKADFENLFSQLEKKNISHVFYLWPLSLGAETKLDNMVSSSAQLGYLIQAISNQGENEVKLIIACRNAQIVTDRDPASNLNLSPLWGLGQLIQNEHPNIHCQLVDLDKPSSFLKHENWFSYLAHDKSNDLAFRPEGIFTKRLARSIFEGKETTISKEHIATEHPICLDMLKKGQLDSFVYRKTERQSPGANEVEIKTHYSALNFKDILKAYGTISAEVTTDTYYGSAIGMELTGEITQIGADITEFAVGDEVVATAVGAFRSYVTVDKKHVLHKPSNVKLRDFFIHANFLTAYYGLISTANISPADRILIHSATGGLGLAAIQIAKWKGAKIFATAGTQEKRDYLRSLGIKNVMDSRSLDFVEQIRSSTNGEGVDIVLNALSGEALKQSFDLLASHGRFIEVGKKDISDNSTLPMATFNKNITFAALDMDRIYADKLELMSPILNSIKDRFEDGTFTALPTTVFTAQEVADAFRHMAQAKHIGKIVIKYENQAVDVISETQESSIYKSEASYIITGGTSGFGLELAKWLGNRNVGKLILVSRSGAATDEAKQVIIALEKKGVPVQTPKLDITDNKAVKDLVNTLSNSTRPLRGVFHGAMVLDDGLMRDMEITRYTKVMAPKISGAINLYESCQNLPLDFFVMFSSIASLVGNRGQANYIAANSFLDEFSHVARRSNFPAITINWGVLAETGVAARNTEVSELLAKEGVYGLTNEEALTAMDRLIITQKSQIGVLSIDWHKWGKIDQNRKSLSRFSELIQDKADTDDGNLKAIQLVKKLNELPTEEQLSNIETTLQETVAKILKLTPNKVDVNQDISTLGIDSLMFMELTLTAQDTFGITLSTMELMKEPIISDFAKTVLDKLFFLYDSTESPSELLN